MMDAGKKDRCPKQGSPRMQDFLQGMPLAMAYVPWQHMQNLYEPEQALRCGTVFPELNMPFLGRKGCRS
ncbi:MAG: spore coat associated protein CotJA [Lachnospiraceae bacterium]